MPDPNARRDKALEAIARELGHIHDTLKKIERGNRPVVNYPYFKETDVDTDSGEETTTYLGPNPSGT